MTDAQQQADRPPCEGRTKDRQPCRGKALPGSRWCLFHDPAKAAARAEGRKRGGKTRSKPAAVLPADTPDAPLKSVRDVIAFLGRTANDVRKGALDAKVGNCLAGICGQLLSALDDELAKELDEARRELEARNHGGQGAAGAGEIETGAGQLAGSNGGGGQGPVRLPP
jgi:hypothetical protein